MDQRSAVILLRKGAEGVAEWNDFRKSLEKAPSLHKSELSRAKLSGVNLLGTDLSGANFFKADLSGADLSGADLSGADLSGANLTGANLSAAKLTEANLSAANLTCAKLNAAILQKANLSSAKLSQANLHTTTLSAAKLIGADLCKANLFGANLAGADLTSANLTEARLYWANLSEASLSGANLTRADLTGAELPSANLAHADLTSAKLVTANLADAFLVGTTLFGSNFTRADARGANFDESTLHPNPDNTKGVAFKEFVSEQFRRLSWQAVRAVGSLAVLTRASYIMLALVPMLAAVWQGVNVWTGHAKLETGQEVRRLDEKLENLGDSRAVQRLDRLWEWMEKGKPAVPPEGPPEVEQRPDASQSTVSSIEVGEIKAEITHVREKVAQAKTVVDGLSPRLPTAWVYGYLAALLAVAGHFVYQMFCPEVLKEQSVDGYAKAHRDAFSVSDPSHKDQLVRAVGHLRELADRHPHWRYPNLIERHGRIVWIPGEIELFTNKVISPKNEGDPPIIISIDPGLMQVAIEEGARADYLRQSLTKRPAAAIALFCYAAAGVFIAIIVVTQTLSVFKAAFG